MFDNSNPYTPRMEIVEGITRYYVSFTDGQAVLCETEVSRPVYMEFLRFAKVERNLKRWDERHTEKSFLTDKTLNQRAFNSPKSLEDTAFDKFLNEQIKIAIQNLPEIQRRRFVLYHEFNLTYKQIAKIEGCSIVAVKYTIDKAKAAIKQKFKNF